MRKAADSVAAAIPEIDIYRCATLLITAQGNEAEIKAAIYADRFLAVGDIEGQRVWKRILLAIKELNGSAAATSLACH